MLNGANMGSGSMEETPVVCGIKSPGNRDPSERRPALKIVARRFPELGPPTDAVAGKWAILWDGDCGFCRRSVDWVLAKDVRELMVAKTYQDCLDWLPVHVRELSERQVHLRSPDGRYWGGGAAFTRILGLLGHPIAETVLGLPIMRHIVELGYRWVANHRMLASRLLGSRLG